MDVICLRSHEPKLFRLVTDYVESRPGGTSGYRPLGYGRRARTILEAPTGTAPPSARTTMSGSSSSSIVEKHDVELAHLLGFADQVDLDDLAVGDREADHRPAQPARGPDERWDSVHDGPLRAAGSPGAD